MMTGWSKFVMMAALVCLLPMAGGCLIAAAGAAGVGAAVYAGGALKESMAGTPDKVATATEKAFTSMKLSMVSKEASKLDGKVIGRTASDKKISVDIKLEGENISKVSIRVGFWGSETESRQLMDEIKKNLKP